MPCLLYTSPTQFIYIAMLCFGGKQKMLQELGCGQFLAISQFDDFGNILHLSLIHISPIEELLPNDKNGVNL